MAISDIIELRQKIGFYDVKDQLRRHVYDRSLACFAAGNEARDGIRDARALAVRQEAMRDRFIRSFGGLPPSGTPLSAETRATLKESGLSIENVLYQSRPGTYVTANLYVPDGITRPTGAVLFLSGHFREARLSEEYQVVCRHLARAGLVVLAPDPPGQGERWSYYERSLGAPTVEPGTMEHDYAGAQCLLLGDGIARYFVHDAMRGVDYLSARPEVNPGRIGVTGNSGGGTQTSLLMVVDPRIAAAAPATFIMSRESYLHTGQAQDAEQVWKGMSAAGFDHEDILLMMVPRPVLVLAVTSDFFPIEGTRTTVERTRRFWEMAGVPGGIELFEDRVEHHYTPRMATKVAEFFSLHLNGRAVAPESRDVAPIPQPRLWCTRRGQVREEFPEAEAAHEETCRRLEEIERRRKRRAERAAREDARAWLRGKVFQDRRPCPANLRDLREWLGSQENGLVYRLSLWWSQEGIMGGSVLFKDHRLAEAKLPLTIGLWQHGTGALDRHRTWIMETCGSGRAVLVPDLSGMGMLEPNALNDAPKFGHYGTLFKLGCDLVWLDDSVPALRTWELIRTIDVVTSDFADVDPTDLRLHARGRYSVYGELAAFLDPRIRELTVEDGLESFAGLAAARHYDDADVLAVILPDTLLHFDLPDLRRWRKG